MLSPQLAAGYTELAFGDRPLGESIEALWSFRAEAEGDYRILPDGRLDVLVRFVSEGDGKVADARLVLAGPTDRCFTVFLQRETAFVGVRFRAGWGPACVGVSGALLRNRVLLNADAESLLGSRAGLLLAARNIADLKASLRAVAAQLIAERKADLQSAEALDVIHQLHVSGGRLSVAELAASTGVPERSLRRWTLDAAGLPPKRLGSVLRFQRTLRLMRGPDHLSLAAAACEGGYSDQSHMTRDFMQHGGFTPNRIPAITLVTMDGLRS